MLFSSYLGTVLDKDAATGALVAKLSLAFDGTLFEAIHAYLRINVFATLDGAIFPDVSEATDLLGHLSALISTLR